MRNRYEIHIKCQSVNHLTIPSLLSLQHNKIETLEIQLEIFYQQKKKIHGHCKDFCSYSKPNRKFAKNKTFKKNRTMVTNHNGGTGFSLFPREFVGIAEVHFVE